MRLCTTLAEQKCVPSWPSLTENSAPTADVPPKGVPVPWVTAGLGDGVAAVT